jgi:hypothetical protein
MQDNVATAAPTAQVPSKSEFVKVEGGEPERTSAEGSVFLAYGLMWGIMVFFLWRTIRGLRVLDTEADNLNRALSKGSR